MATAAAAIARRRSDASGHGDDEEELECGAFSREADPMEVELDRASAVKDHPDFAFLDRDELRALYASRGAGSTTTVASSIMNGISSSSSNSNSSATGTAGKKLPEWMLQLPVEKDPSKWRILEVQIRPDRAWWIIKELMVTVCMGKGLVVAEETPSSVLFRKKVSQESLANGMANTAAYQNVYIRIGVLPSKLRVLDVCCLVSGENKLLGGLVSSTRNPLSADRTKPLAFALDQLFGAIQATLISQYLSLSHLFMSTPENTTEEDVTDAELDPGYVQDVKRMFASEMKANMRDLCIPLEEYAYEQEFACALLIGLLDPLYKKYNLTLTEEAAPAGAASLADALAAASVASDAAANTNSSSVTNGDPDEQKAAVQVVNAAVATGTRKASKCYGEVVNDMVHALWNELTAECERKVKTKIDEKQKQVTARADAAQRLRVRAVRTIMDHAGADVTSLKAPASGDDRRNDVLLHDCSSVINSVPVKLHVTYGALLYRTMVPLFATTTVVPFDDIARVVQTTSYGIKVVSVELRADSTTRKPLTIATGLEVDLLFQLLAELLAMHEHARASQQQAQQDAVLLKTLLSYEEDEHKAHDDDDDDDDTESDVAFKRALEQSEAFS